MRLGFVGSAHKTLGCHPDKSFRLASYSEERLILTVQKNFECIVKILEFNLANNILFYRIADFIPFASHPICYFDNNFKALPEAIKERLVIENDERMYNLDDCLAIHQRTRIPVVFDIFHNNLFSNWEKDENVIELVQKTCKKIDGALMVDYSTQEPGKKFGRHASTIDLESFREFLIKTEKFDFDVMLEVKDKEKSAIKAIQLLKELGRV